MNKKNMIELIIKYYISIDRQAIPDINNYSKKELQKVCELFMLF